MGKKFRFKQSRKKPIHKHEFKEESEFIRINQPPGILIKGIKRSKKTIGIWKADKKFIVGSLKSYTTKGKKMKKGDKVVVHYRFKKKFESNVLEEAEEEFEKYV